MRVTRTKKEVNFMAFVPAYSQTLSYKKNSGHRGSVSSRSTVSSAVIVTEIQKKVALMSGQSVRSITNSTTVDPATEALGHTDEGQRGLLNIFSPSTDERRTLRVEDMSLSYKATANDGTIDMTNTDVVAYLTAWKAANPTPSDWQYTSGEYSQD
jgi:hypothetical protein